MTDSVVAAAASKTLHLSRPVRAHGEEITTLTFREPTGADAWECGMPIKFSAENEVIVSMPAMMSLASRLAAVPLSTLKSMPLSDVMNCVGIITGFLASSTETEPDQSSEPLTLPGSTRLTPPTSLRSA